MESPTRAGTANSPQQAASQGKPEYVKRQPRREGNDDYGSKRWLENQIIIIIRAAMNGRPATYSPRRVRGNGVVVEESTSAAIPRNHALALSGCMQLARLKGLIVEKRQSLKGTIDLGKLPASEAKATLEQMLDSLQPGERAKVLQIMSVAADIPEVL